MELHKISLEDFIAGKECRFESIHNPIFYRCLYKIKGKKYKARICFETGTIMIENEVVRRCNLGGIYGRAT